MIDEIVNPHKPITFNPQLTTQYVNKLWHKDFFIFVREKIEMDHS